MKKRQLSIALAAFLTASAVAPAAGMPVSAASSGNTVFINEVESDDPNGGNDWIEIVNTGDQAVDISGWFVTDDKGLERLTSNETKQFPDGTVLEAGAVMVLEDSIDFSFGLGKSDTVSQTAVCRIPTAMTDMLWELIPEYQMGQESLLIRVLQRER